MIYDTDNDPKAHPQSMAAVLAYLQRWGVLASMNYSELTFQNLQTGRLNTLQDYLSNHGMDSQIRGFWDTAHDQGEIYFIFDTSCYTFERAVCVCERILFTMYGYELWGEEDERLALNVQQRKADQRVKRLTNRAHDTTEHK